MLLYFIFLHLIKVNNFKIPHFIFLDLKLKKKSTYDTVI